MKNRQPAESASMLVQFVRTLQLSVHLFMSDRVPGWTKLIPIGAFLYVLSPIDVIPDFLVGIGQLDDLTIILMALWAFIQLAPADVVREFRGDSNVVSGRYRVIKDEPGTGNVQSTEPSTKPVQRRIRQRSHVQIQILAPGPRCRWPRALGMKMERAYACSISFLTSLHVTSH